MITCKLCGIAICHEAEFLPDGCVEDDDGVTCGECAADNYDGADDWQRAYGEVGGDSPAYRAAMRDAGRGRLLKCGTAPAVG